VERNARSTNAIIGLDIFAKIGQHVWQHSPDSRVVFCHFQGSPCEINCLHPIHIQSSLWMVSMKPKTAIAAQAERRCVTRIARERSLH